MRRTSFLLCMLALGACTSDTFVGDDGGGDTGTSGEGGSTEGGHAEGGKAEAGATRYCDTVDAQFCADFDLPEDAGAGFSMPPQEEGGWSVTFQNTLDKSPPVAVRFDTLGDAGGVAFFDNAFLAKSGSPLHTRLVVEADVYLPVPGFTPDPIYVIRAGSAPNMFVGLAAHTGVWKLMGAIAPTALNPQPATNQWVHMVLGIDLGPSATVTVDIGAAHADGTAVTGTDAGGPYPGYLAAGAAQKYIETSPLTFYVDNVVARWQ